MTSDDWRKRWEIRHEQACGRFCAGPEQCEIAFRLTLLDENEALRAAANDLIVGMSSIYHNVCQPCSACVIGFRKALGDAS